MANLEFYDTRTCAMQEIHNLQYFEGKPREAMINFCRSNLGRPVVWKIVDPSGNDKGRAGALFSFYFFSGPTNRRYGSQFAEFIKENELGKLIESPALTNHAYHPDHANQIWIWMPDVTALNRWWKANQTKTTKG